ncbi:magnesium transporter [Thiohalorhabdus sp. Cl-TMA]|uniref:Magnesium transporter n=1 Tax=Thiohalorhabdus methylotrophus TaxID=3242694 RepID=A0ABV4TS43_9GAMM
MGAENAVAALNQRFLAGYPREAATRVAGLEPGTAAAILAGGDVETAARVWDHLPPDTGAELLERQESSLRTRLLAAMEPARAVRLLAGMEEPAREALLEALSPGVAKELRTLLAYPPETAGQWMDPRVTPLHSGDTVQEALQRIRRRGDSGAAVVYLVDEEERLVGQVPIRDLALADPDRTLGALARPADAAVSEFDPREELVDHLERYQVTSVPVVDYAGRLVGVLHQSSLVAAVQEDLSADLPAMVGASREERALSTVGFSVTRRLPWLFINLLTAFLAASVVGLFESTIARFTALAVLLPVVAGQSGNAGAQALAITMRGLALREITARHGWRVALKEVRVGALNGLAIAGACAGGVLVWSGSSGLALVIALSMVLAMVAAGLAGALIPVLLTRLGQDPAQSSTIILTTVTDVVGFAAFLGIASLLAGLL